MKRSSPEFFANRDVLSEEIQNALKHQFYVTLPVTPSRCNVILQKLSVFDHRKFVFDAAIKTFIMTAGELKVT
jgi:hypothetical protein